MLSASQIVDEMYARLGASVQLLPFTYTRSFTGVGAAPANLPMAIKTDNDSDFIWFDTRSIAYTAAGVPQLRVRAFLSFRLGVTGRALTEPIAPALAVAGQAERPFVFYDPIVIPARSALFVTLTTLVDTIDSLELSLSGVKAVQGARL
jgi:hypothetical protein